MGLNFAGNTISGLYLYDEDWRDTVEATAFLGKVQVRPYTIDPDSQTERIEWIMMSDGSGRLYVPIKGGSTKYRFRVSIDGGSYNIFEYNSQSPGRVRIATGLTRQTAHNVIIRAEKYGYRGWANRLGGTYGNPQLIEVVHDSCQYGFTVSSNASSDGYRDSLYYNCTNLTTVPAVEYFPDYITDLGYNFRRNEYYGCTSLANRPAEYLPNTVNTIKSNFRSYQFYGCTGLTGTVTEFIPNSVTNIRTGFRDSQFAGCTGLTGVVESLPPNLTNYGGVTGNMRPAQFQWCTGITDITMAASSLSSSNSRVNQYTDAGQNSGVNVTILGNVVENCSNSAGLNNNYVNYIKVSSSLLSGYQNSADWSSVSSKFISL